MELQDLQSLLVKPDELQKAIVAEKPATAAKAEDVKKQYDPKLHSITDTAKRPDKTIETDNGPQTIEVARLPIPMQKRIVRLAATFLCGRPIELTSNPADELQKKLLAVITKTWKDNKLDYKSKKLAKLMMGEMECAELWYTEESEEGFWMGTANDQPKVKFKLRMKVLADKFGDALYPVFNSAGDMIAFGRGYKVGKVEHFDLYTAETNYFFEKGDTGWTQTKTETNLVKKIPVIYYSQEAPEWYDVQELIERFEKSISNHGDTNDYHGSPMIKVKGTVKGFAKKGESGKIIELEGENADAEYMGWTQAPESVKLEQENLLKLIDLMTSTPNISFEVMKSLSEFSGVALKMLFMDAHMKASEHEENFGEGVQRRINYIKAAMAIINVDFEKAVTLTVEPKFNYFLPKNESELVDILTTATTGGILSKKTAIAQNPFVQDPDAEETLIKNEENSAGALEKLMQ